MKRVLRRPASRVGKKQLTVYLDLEAAHAVHSYAEEVRKTIQEIVAESINLFLLDRGVGPLLSVGHIRVFKRKKGISRPRVGVSAKSRRGRRSLAGWFDAAQVADVHRVVEETEVPVKFMFTIGFGRLRGLTLDGGSDLTLQ